MSDDVICTGCGDTGFVETLIDTVFDSNGKMLYYNVGLIFCSGKCLARAKLTDSQIDIKLALSTKRYFLSIEEGE